MRVLLLVLAGCAHSAPLETEESALAPGIHLTSRTVPYAVRGGSVAELRAEMQRIGPIDDGRHQFAFTWGNFAWRYPFHKADGTCGTGPVSVELEIVQTLPEWLTPTANTLAEWRRWLAATRAHEDGHRRILLETAQKISAELSALSALPSCDELDHAANQRGSELLREMRTRHADYDRETKHGATTGAYLRE